MICSNCKSSKTEFDEAYGFHKCLDCLHVWGFDKHDPDYDDLKDLLEDRPASMKLSAEEPDYVLVHKKALLVNTLALFYACKALNHYDQKLTSEEYSEELGVHARKNVNLKSESEIYEVIKSLVSSIDQDPRGISIIKLA